MPGVRASRLRFARLVLIAANVALGASCGGAADIVAPPPPPLPVPASVSITPGTATLMSTTTRSFSTEVRDNQGAVMSGQSVSWSVADTAILAVSGGVVTARAPGTSTVIATVGTIQGKASVTVIPVPVASVVVTPSSTTSSAGQTLQLVASAKDSAGAALTGRTFVWTSGDTSIATVSATGLVSIRKIGQAVVSAAADGKSGSATIVAGEPIATFVASAKSATLAVGATLQLSVAAKDNGGHLLTNRAIRWSTSNASIARVDSLSGLVTGTGDGLATITVQAEGMRADVSLAVGSAVPLVIDPRTISAGAHMSCGLISSGEAYCWGANFAGQLGIGATTTSGTANYIPTRVAGGHRFVAISVGSDDHTVAITLDGTAYAWGQNLTGQLGDGTTANRTVPVAVSGGMRFRSVSAGNGFTLGLDASGKAYAWGSNFHGELGIGSSGIPGDQRTAPVAVAGGRSFTSVDAGDSHSVALMADGTAWAWGANTDGQLGDGSTVNRSSPVAVSGGLTFRSIAAGGVTLQDGTQLIGHTVGLTSTGIAYAWGNNKYGQLGDGTNTSRSVPVPVALGRHYAAVDAGGYFTTAIGIDSAAYGWGDGASGELGNLNNGTSSTVPVAASGRARFSAISAGVAHSVASDATGWVYGWGQSQDGQLGFRYIHSYEDQPNLIWGFPSPLAPQPDLSLGGVVPKRLAAGLLHGCALAADSTAWCWGDNTFGQLGDGTTTSRANPTPVAGGHRFVAIYASGFYDCSNCTHTGRTIALTASGEAWAWGFNGGALGDGSTTDRVVPVPVSTSARFVAIALGAGHTIGLTATGAAYAWGANAWGQRGTSPAEPPDNRPHEVSGGRRFVSIAAASSRSFGVDAAGITYAWGDGTWYPTGVSIASDVRTPWPVASAPAFRSIAAGYWHTLGVTPSGTLYSWGMAQDSGLARDFANPGTPLPAARGFTFSSVGSGLSFSAGLTTDGSVVAWGRNESGQLGDSTTTPRTMPQPIAGARRFVALDVGDSFVLAMTQDGAVYSWGANESGQLGSGTAGGTRSTPAPVTGTAVGLPAVGSVVVTPDSVSLPVGGRTRLTATARSASGLVLQDQPITWVSSDTTHARVSTSGEVMGQALGTAVVTASAGGKTATAMVVVRSATAADTATLLDPRTVVLADSTAARIISVTANEIRLPVDVAAQFKVGSIVAAGITTATPFGLLRTVTSIQPAGAEVVLTTTEARLTDALQRGHGAISIALTPQAAVGTRIGSSRLLNVSGGGFTISADTTFGGVRFTGTLTVTPTLDFGTEVDNSEASELHYTVGGQVTANVKLSVGTKLTQKVDWNLKAWNLSPVLVWFGTMPVILTPTLSMRAGYDVAMETASSTSVTSTSTFKAGAAYSNGTWAPIAEMSTTPSPWEVPRTSATATGSARLYAGPRFSVGVFDNDLLSGNIDVVGYGKAVLKVPSDTLWWVFAGVNASASISSKWLDDRKWLNLAPVVLYKDSILVAHGGPEGPLWPMKVGNRWEYDVTNFRNGVVDFTSRRIQDVVGRLPSDSLVYRVRTTKIVPGLKQTFDTISVQNKADGLYEQGILTYLDPSPADSVAPSGFAMTGTSLVSVPAGSFQCTTYVRDVGGVRVEECWKHGVGMIQRRQLTNGVLNSLFELKARTVAP